MTYCVTEVRLMEQAGERLCKKLLPEVFTLRYSKHSTGTQMTILSKEFPEITVWRGSIWHSQSYEFNDSKDVPGLQPNMDFARDIITRYFEQLATAVAEVEAETTREDLARTASQAHIAQAKLDRFKSQVLKVA